VSLAANPQGIIPSSEPALMMASHSFSESSFLK